MAVPSLVSPPLQLGCADPFGWGSTLCSMEASSLCKQPQDFVSPFFKLLRATVVLPPQLQLHNHVYSPFFALCALLTAVRRPKCLPDISIIYCSNYSTNHVERPKCLQLIGYVVIQHIVIFLRKPTIYKCLRRNLLHGGDLKILPPPATF